jgi:AcrR family transcriptional regulator
MSIPSKPGEGREMAIRGDRDMDTASAILGAAERLVQTRGFNAFSYADVAKELGITKPALHYHFAGTAELGEAMLLRYTARFSQALETIEATTTNAARKLEAYADLYAQVLAQDRMCLYGMLATDFAPSPTRCARPSSASSINTRAGWPPSSSKDRTTGRYGSTGPATY